MTVYVLQFYSCMPSAVLCVISSCQTFSKFLPISAKVTYFVAVEVQQWQCGGLSDFWLPDRRVKSWPQLLYHQGLLSFPSLLGCLMSTAYVDGLWMYRHIVGEVWSIARQHLLAQDLWNGDKHPPSVIDCERTGWADYTFFTMHLVVYQLMGAFCSLLAIFMSMNWVV